MKIAISQINNHIGHFEQQLEKFKSLLDRSHSEEVDLLIFPEMAIGGYPAKDLWQSSRFLQKCQDVLQEIAIYSKNTSVLIGLPTANEELTGKPAYNSFAFISDGKIQHIGHKCLLPDYDVFDEFRYFEPHNQISILELKGYKFAITICEDLWNVGSRNLYKNTNPVDQINQSQVDFVVNLAASPFSKGHFYERIKVFEHQFSKIKKPLFYANQVGAFTDLIFDGHSMVFDGNGKLLDVLAGFEEDFSIYAIEQGEIQLTRPKNQIVSNVDQQVIPTLHKALVFGLRDYFRKNNFKTAVLGLSGGLDSAVVAALACEALGPENVYAILMPSQYSSESSLKDAHDLVENTGCHSTVIPIHNLVQQFEETLAPSFKGKKPDLTEENIQARTRGILLMAQSNKFGHILLNTSNKSEAAVGYGTLYGDMNGSLSVIGDVYKTEVYELAHYINREKEIIPHNTIVKAPSAELRPDQKDSDSLPNYDFLDKILSFLIEEGMDAQEIIEKGYDAQEVQRIHKLLHGAEFKRKQSAPALRVSKKAFGSGWSYPLVKYNSLF